MTLDHIVDDLDGVVLLKFWAPWCAPCRVMSPKIEAICKETGTRLLPVNVDAIPESSRHFNVLTIPTVILFKDAVEIARFSGNTIPLELLTTLRELP